MKQTTNPVLASCGDCLWRGLGCAWFWVLQQRRPAKLVPPLSFASWFPGPGGPGAGVLGDVEGQVLSGVCHTPHGLLLPKHSVPSTPGHAPQTSPAPPLAPQPRSLFLKPPHHTLGCSQSAPSGWESDRSLQSSGLAVGDDLPMSAPVSGTSLVSW